MLRPPYTRYTSLHIYNVDTSNIEIDDPDLIAVWKEGSTSLVFFHKKKHDLIYSLSKKEGFNVLFYTEIPYSEWESGKFVETFEVGEFLIVPVWEKEKLKDNEKSVLIDPSVAFGTGFHPTTRMILEIFYEFAKRVKVKNVLDIGCGTGLLSIFAKKLGAENIVAIDNSSVAVEVSSKNFYLNQCENIELKKMDVFDFLRYEKRSFDIVFANLYYNILEKLFKDERFWGKNAFFFISGYLKSMEKAIFRNLPSYVKVVKREERDSWAMAVLKNERGIQ